MPHGEVKPSAELTGVAVSTMPDINTVSILLARHSNILYYSQHDFRQKTDSIRNRLNSKKQEL